MNTRMTFNSFMYNFGVRERKQINTTKTSSNVVLVNNLIIAGMFKLVFSDRIIVLQL